MPNLDAIVALRACAVAFNAPQTPLVSGEDQPGDLYSLCAARCCDLVSACVASALLPTPTEVASSVRSASLLSPDSSGSDGFEGPLALHAACDLLHLASWRTVQTAGGAAAAGAELLCPADLMGDMAAAAASLSDLQMYGPV